jgi:hypothetical protein
LDVVLSLLWGFFGVFSHGLHELEIISFFIRDSCGEEKFGDKIDNLLIWFSLELHNSGEWLFEVLYLGLILLHEIINIGGFFPLEIKGVCYLGTDLNSINTIVGVVSVVSYDILATEIFISLLVSLVIIDKIKESFFFDKS